MKVYKKAIAAGLTFIVALAGVWVPGVNQMLPPEIIATLAGLITTVLVYALPNEVKTQ